MFPRSSSFWWPTAVCLASASDGDSLPRLGGGALEIIGFLQSCLIELQYWYWYDLDMEEQVFIEVGGGRELQRLANFRRNWKWWIELRSVSRMDWLVMANYWKRWRLVGRFRSACDRFDSRNGLSVLMGGVAQLDRSQVGQNASFQSSSDEAPAGLVQASSSFIRDFHCPHRGREQS